MLSAEGIAYVVVNFIFWGCAEDLERTSAWTYAQQMCPCSCSFANAPTCSLPAAR